MANHIHICFSVSDMYTGMNTRHIFEGIGYNSDIKQMQKHTLKEHGYSSDIKIDLSHSSQKK